MRDYAKLIIVSASEKYTKKLIFHENSSRRISKQRGLIYTSADFFSEFENPFVTFWHEKVQRKPIIRRVNSSRMWRDALRIILYIHLTTCQTPILISKDMTWKISSFKQSEFEFDSFTYGNIRYYRFQEFKFIVKLFSLKVRMWSIDGAIYWWNYVNF